MALAYSYFLEPSIHLACNEANFNALARFGPEEKFQTWLGRASSLEKRFVPGTDPAYRLGRVQAGLGVCSALGKEIVVNTTISIL